MSNENIKKFIELVNKDEGLRKKLNSAAESYAGNKDDVKAIFEAVILPVAKEAGLELSYADMEELMKAPAEGELAMADMKNVAGGIRNDTLDKLRKMAGISPFC